MSSTALQTALRVRSSVHPSVDPLRLSEYRGVTTAANYGANSPQVELEVMSTGCGVYDLGFRAKILLTGNDRARWLNGMVTNNIRDLAAGHGVYAFLLNPQGRILGDMYAYNLGESIILDSDRVQVEKLLATFDHYIIMDDVEVRNLSEESTAIGIAGPKSRETLTAAGFAVPELQPLQLEALHWQGVECTLVRGEQVRSERVRGENLETDAPGNESYEIWMEPSHVEKVWDALLQAGAVPVGFEALEMQRILLGVPVYGTDIRERELPQETEQTGALNFTKGCYVGQEIVERIRSRGNVHRRFTGFLVEDGTPVHPGEKILAEGKEVGEITSATSLQRSEERRTLALGYIRREAGNPGSEVTIAGARASIVSLPVSDAVLWQAHNALANG